MAEGTKPCKICGTPFVPCLTQLPFGFNWRTVACSPECGQVYLHKIMVSRGLIDEQPEETETKMPADEEIAEEQEPEIEEAEIPRKKKK